MARSLNSSCDFQDGYFSCNLPVDNSAISGLHGNQVRVAYPKEDKEEKDRKIQTFDETN